MFQGSLKDISKKSKGCFKEVSKVFQGTFRECFKEISRKCKQSLLQGNFSFKCVSICFDKCFMGDSWMFQGCFKKVARVFKEFNKCFENVSSKS